MAAADPPGTIPTVRSPAAGCLSVAIRLLLAVVAGVLAAQVTTFAISWISEGLADVAGLVVGLAAVVLAWIYLQRFFPPSAVSQPTHLSHWSTMIEGLAASPQDFYRQIVEGLKERQVPDLETSFIYAHEGGPLSAKRLYLEARRGQHVFHICGAPFGNGFFVSWWLGEVRGALVTILSLLPFAEGVLPWVFRPRTYYEIDTALMFQSLIHSAVLAVVDGLTKEKGVRTVSEGERKPILRDFLEK